MHLELFDYALWFGTPLVQAVILFAMYRRKLSLALSAVRRLHDCYRWFPSRFWLCIFYRSYNFTTTPIRSTLGLSVFALFAVIYEVTSLQRLDRDDRSL